MPSPSDMPPRLVGIDIHPWAGQLQAWGHGPDGWWALVTWAEQVQAFGESHRALQCAGWVHASRVRPGEHARPDEYADVPRQHLVDDRRMWPPPATEPGVAWPDRWNIGVLDGSELPLPPGWRRFRHDWP
jgi:hypothetical protein